MLQVDFLPAAGSVIFPAEEGVVPRRLCAACGHFPHFEVVAVVVAGIELERKAALFQVGEAVARARLVPRLVQRRKHPDLVMTDLWMPDRNGADLARALKQDPATADIPVLLVTADTEMTGDADDTQFSTVIYKPINIARISAALKNTLNR